MPFLDFKGINVYFRKFGVKTELPPLVLIHGAFANHLTWYSQIKFFSPRTELYVLDLPGHGQSDRPKLNYTPHFFSKVVNYLLEYEQITRPILAGHSLGGVIAQTFALEYPSKITKLILLCTGVNTLSQLRSLISPAALPAIERLLSLFSWPLFCKILAKITAKHEIPGLEGIRLEARMAASCSGRVFLNIMKHLLMYDLSAKVSSIHVPILFITGTKDLFYKQIPFYNHLPNAVVRVVKGGEHVLQLLNPEPNYWMLEFIQGRLKKK
ncbi:MAG: alpha/beta fold hydrolase [Candidatus Helarchaeota archaeon]